jgi:hypothetical protein
MVLSGHAANLAAEAGLGELAVSLTHEEDIAAAVVVGLCSDGGVGTNQEMALACELASNGAH